MQAVVFHSYGGPDRLTLRRVPLPIPGKGEVRVRIRTTTVTRTDTCTLRAHPFFARAMTGWLTPKIRTLGMDFAGDIEALGKDVTEFQIGDRVFGLVPDQYGAHAEYLCLPAQGAIAHIPETLFYDDAVVGEGAWYASATTQVLEAGQTCLIYGASGAIGTAAVQLAKVRGAHVTAVVGTRHLELANKLGADRVVDYQTEDFTQIGERFDLVLDAVGKTSWFACRPLLGPRAIFAATDLGPFWSNIVLSGWHSLTRRSRVRVPYPEDAPGFVRHLASLMAQGRFTGVFDRRFSLDQIAEAFRYVETGQKTGIVRVQVRSPEAADNK